MEHFTMNYLKLAHTAEISDLITFYYGDYTWETLKKDVINNTAMDIPCTTVRFWKDMFMNVTKT